jgi:hypothetical protein
MPVEWPPAPWHAFFADVDEALSQPVVLHCLGGFVATHCYGVPRQTDDVDYFSLTPISATIDLEDLAGKHSALHRKHGLYVKCTGIVTLPESYLDRLVAIFPGTYQRLQFFGLDVYDLLLSKLERGGTRDRDDVKYLFHAGQLDFSSLESRYRLEMRPYFQC